MIKNIFLSVIFFIFSQIKYAKEDKVIEKNDSKNLNESENLQIKPFLIDDYCNVGQSQIVTRFFTEVYEYFNSSVIYPDKCLILDNIFNKYSTQFEYISEYNHESFLYFTCPFCHKDFKSSPLLNLHYKLFHMKINESLICPGDFCMSINCNKYYDYFTIKKFSKEPGDVKFNRFENGVVYVSMIGACSNCMVADVTLEDGIEAALINEIPEVIKVVNED